MWFRKNKETDEQKVIREMKEKAEQIAKLKSEVTEMGKLILKDGKLTKVEDAPKQLAAPVQKTQEQIAEEKLEQEMQAIERQRQRPMVPPPIEQPVGPTEEEIRYYQQQQLAAQQQAYMQQQRSVPQQETRRYQQQDFLVAIELVHGNIIQINVPMEKFESFVQEMNVAIDNKCAIPVGNKIVNGEHVVVYYIVERDGE